MALPANREDVSLSFHYFLRRRKVKAADGKEKLVNRPFIETDFQNLFDNLKKQKGRKLTEAKFFEQLRRKSQVTIETLEKDERFIFGIYGNSYSGHEFSNSDHGVISAESLNIRPFFFMLYLSEKGHIYVASQYLGNYGGYSTLKDTLFYLLGDNNELSAISFNTNRAFAKYAEPKEVEVTYSKKSTNIAKGNSYGRSGMISFRKSEKDETFEKNVKKDFFSLLSKNDGAKQKAIAEIMRDNKLYELADEDIDDCKIIAFVNKKQRVIQMFDDLNRASRFPINVQVDKNGHPPYAAMKKEAKELIKTEILAVKPDA